MNFRSDNHALLCGHVLGALLMRLHETGPYHVVPVVDDAGDYTPKLMVLTPSGTYEVTVQPVEE